MTIKRFPKGVALVIGGSGGMGSVICETLAAHGSNIALTYHHNRQRAEEVAEKVRSLGRAASIHCLDIGDESRVGETVAEISANHRIHTVVVASGSDIKQQMIGDLEPRDWRTVLDADANGFFNVVHYTLPHLKSGGGGSYVHLSTCGMQRWPDGDALSVAPKACIDALLRGVAREEGRNGVRANSIAVGVIEAGIFMRLWEKGTLDEKWRMAVLRNLCLKRFGKPQEVAEAVLYLATADYVTGQTIAVSGGYGI
jgi:NAD(P)-dependent dehydrogenase (short-subunit alcohol dehydrogenase family)